VSFTLTRRNALFAGAALAATAVADNRALSQSYPSRPVRLLIGAAAGSVPDIVARIIGDQLAIAIGQAVIVENRPGPGGVGAVQTLLASASDGYTLALATINQMVFNSYLFAKLPYDPVRDIEPISLVASNPFSLAVSNSFPVATFNDFIVGARAEPGKLSVGTAPPGTAPNVFAHMMSRLTGIEVIFVPYRSGLDGLNGMLRDDIQLLVDSPAIMIPQARAGKIKVLAVTGSSREAELPDVPTIAQAGFSTLECDSWFGLVAPKGTSPTLTAMLNHQIAEILASKQVRQHLIALSLEPRGGTPDDFRKLIEREHTRWGPILREAAIKLD
jgi:tripartite-type tricarboxylate transporter receptor subunit TctC